MKDIIQQIEDLIFNIGQQAPYKTLHTEALNLHKSLCGLERKLLSPEDSPPSEPDALTDEEKLQQQKAERKLKKWAQDQSLAPAKILTTFLDMDRGGSFKSGIYKRTLEAHFVNTDSSLNFSSNFDQMKNMSEKNHAKIFEVSPNGKITIWQPILKYIQEYKDSVFKNPED